MRTKKQAEESMKRALSGPESFKAYVIKYSFITMMIAIYFSAVLLGLDRSAQTSASNQIIFSEMTSKWKDLFDMQLGSRAEQAKKGARGIEVWTSIDWTEVSDASHIALRRF